MRERHKFKMQIDNKQKPANPAPSGTPATPSAGEPNNTPPADPNQGAGSPPPTPPNSPAPANPAPAGNPTPAQPDYQGKFAESSRENQVIKGENTALKERLNSLTKIKEPTDEEMQARHENWAYMSEAEQSMAKENFKLGQQVNNTHNLILDVLSNTEKREALASVYTQHPELAKRKADFEAYLRKPTHKGSSVGVLAKAFLQDFKDDIEDENAQAGDPPALPVTPPAEGLESGSGGGESGAGVQPTYTDEQIVNLRKSDPKKYNELIRKGVI